MPSRPEIPVDARPPADLTLEIRKLIMSQTYPFDKISRVHYHPFRGIWFLDFVINSSANYTLQEFLVCTAFKAVYNKHKKNLIIYIRTQKDFVLPTFNEYPTIWGGSDLLFR